MNPSIKSLLDVLAKELEAQLAQGNSGISSVTPSVSAEPALSDYIWWSSGLSFDPSSRILLGASPETWETLFAADELAARITPLVEQTARSRFGAEVTCLEAERADRPPAEWPSLPLTIAREAEAEVVIYCSVSPDLEAALGASAHEEAKKEGEPLANAGANLAEILMDVTMPVSVSLGRTKMYMKDLLHLANGSIVELDQDLGDEVEIRVNNCVLAYGEVVAVEGNYAVRILRMAPGRNTPDLRGARKTAAA
ncbi:MAG: FliM/FliN family flagellar motor switch protein [Acidobacteriota bacterium]|nr:FliM/FliN family flagellar motor switch protein [Acidobacteriota bacterium]